MEVAAVVVPVFGGLVGVLTEPSVPAAHCVLHQAMAQTLRHCAHDGPMVLAEKPIGLTHETWSVVLLEPRLEIAASRGETDVKFTFKRAIYKILQ